MYDYHKGTGYISGMNHREMVIFTEMISYSADTGKSVFLAEELLEKYIWSNILSSRRFVHLSASTNAATLQLRQEEKRIF